MNTQWIRDPFVHFLVIGGLLFTLYALTSGEKQIGPANEIRIHSEQIIRLQENWVKQHGMEPDNDTLKALVDFLVKEEVMFREAKRIGLDKNDVIVRRRLIQKMEFLSSNLSHLDAPGQQQLRDYYNKNKETYRRVEKRSFRHIYFSREKRGDRVKEDATEVLHNKLDETKPQLAQQLGDNFILQYSYNERGKDKVAQVFGREFAESLFRIDSLQWEGPLVSEYGAHLVRISKLTESIIPSYEEISERVLNDFLSRKLEELKQDTYDEMQARYQIDIDVAENPVVEGQ